MGNYPPKAHTGKGHIHLRPYYLHTENSPMNLPRTLSPRTWQGCDEILGNPYYKSVLLPNIAKSRVPDATPSAPDKYPKDTFFVRSHSQVRPWERKSSTDT